MDINKLEKLELTGEIGLRYMLMFLIVIGIMISINVIVTRQPFNYGFMKRVLDVSFAFIVLVGLVIIARELWFFRVDLEHIAAPHKKTAEKAKAYLERLG